MGFGLETKSQARQTRQGCTLHHVSTRQTGADLARPTGLYVCLVAEHGNWSVIRQWEASHEILQPPGSRTFGRVGLEYRQLCRTRSTAGLLAVQLCQTDIQTPHPHTPPRRLCSYSLPKQPWWQCGDIPRAKATSCSVKYVPGAADATLVCSARLHRNARL